MKKVDFIFEKVLDFLSLLWYVVVLTGGTTYEKHDKRAMARKHHSARGQQKQLKGDEGAARIHGKASRGLGKDLHRRAERNLRKVPRLLDEYMSLAEAAIFEYAFRLGARLIMEVQKDT